MTKPLLLLIYQDCYDCGASKVWHENVQQAAADAGVLIEYTPHNTPGAKKLILEAHKKGVEVPFLSNGKKYSRKLNDLLDTPQDKPKPQKRRKKEVKHEVVSED